MRSRYSAYCCHHIDYVHQTYHRSKRDANSLLALEQFASSSHFIKLMLHSSEQSATEGYVNFSVQYIQGDLLCEFSECSRFVYDNNWYYFDGKLSDNPAHKIGRNDSCPCGSGKKFKLCIEHRRSGNLAKQP